MIRRFFLYILFFCLLISSIWALARDSSTLKENDNKDRCSEYKMRVATPSNEIDYKLQIIKPREDIDFKLMVIDPCKKPYIELAKKPSLPANEKQK
jgi:hypothetical protein